LQLPLNIGGWMPVLVNRTSNLQGITGIVYDDPNLAISYKKASGVSVQLTLTANIWLEVGHGEYWVFLGPTICDVVGLLTIHLTYVGALDYPGAAEVLNVPADGDWLGMIVTAYDEDTLGGILDRIYQRLATGTLRVIAPVQQEGAVVQIIKGDDYYNADSRALEWLEEDGTVGWPVLTGATVTLEVDDKEFAGTIVTATGSNKKVRFELSATQTASLSTGIHLFWVKAALVTTHHKVTLRTGKVYVSDKVTLITPEVDET
jgi:hypothetical protein